MKFYCRVALFIVLVGIISCVSKGDEVAKLKSEVIRVHDEVMPKMGDLRSYQKSLTAKIEEFEKAPAVSNEIQLYKEAATACDNAYEGMFVWMRQFDSRLEGMEKEESILYLQDQLIKVSEVNGDVKKALNDARELLEK